MQLFLKKFQFNEIDEKRIYIKYEGIKLKKSRPYLVINPQINQCFKCSFFLAVPLTKVVNEASDFKKEGKFWLRFNYQEPSFIKMDFPVIFPYSYLESGIVKPINKFLNPSKRKIAMKLMFAALEG